MKLNLSRKIALYVGLLTLVFSLAFSLTAIKLGSSAVEESANETLILLADEGKDLVEAAIHGNINVMEAIARDGQVRTMDWATQKRALDNHFNVLQNEGYLAFGIVYPDGTTLYIDGSEANLGERDYVKKAFAGQTNVSDPIVSKVTNSVVLMYAAPIYDESGKVGGVLVARRPGDALTEITDTIGFGDNGFSLILGADGTFYAQPDKVEIMEQVNIYTDLEEKGKYMGLGQEMSLLGMGNSGIVKYKVDGVTRMVGTAPMSSTGWTFAVGALEDEVLARVDALKTVIFIAGVIFVILGIAVAFFIGRLISRPIVRASEFAVTMAGGDLTETLDDRFLQMTDEVGDLARAFATLGESFRQTISEIQSSAQDLAASSEEMSATAESSSANMEEVSASTEEISASLQEVSAAAQQIAASSEQMSAAGDELVRNMNEGNKTAKETEEQARRIQEDVQNSQQRALNIYNDLDARMKEGIEKAKIVNEISNMADQIAAIADQTNLLALNAAIEAARAGEQGRGFAVVAEEVRKLASDSTETVANIQNLTGQVQQNIEELINDANELLKFMSTDVTEDYKRFMDTATQYRNDAGNFNQITGSAAQMGEQVLHAVEEVTRSITEVTATITQSAEGSNQIAKGTEETSRSMMDINDASLRLANMSQELTRLISHFRV
jgi:methyl-accepting chemotaxis protein